VSPSTTDCSSGISVATQLSTSTLVATSLFSVSQLADTINDLCPVCKGTNIDDYGCMDCFMLGAVASWDEEEDWEDDDNS
jgi:hypothetical protein